MRQLAFAVALLVCAAPSARADDEPCAGAKAVGFRVEGDSKLTSRTLSYLSHVDPGDCVLDTDVPKLEAALISSELFETATVRLEHNADGVVIVATLKDKLSWIAAPTIFVLPSHYSIGAGYAASDIGGENKKMLLYGQVGNATSLFLGTFLDPSYHGTKWTWRGDVYLLHDRIYEYANPVNDPTSFAVDRITTETFLDAGFLVGYTFRWWLIVDGRLRGAYVYFRDSHADDIVQTPLPNPESDGWDVTLQLRGTLDYRSHRYGVTWGPYVQGIIEAAIPGLDSYQYQLYKIRAYYSWKFFEEHELELRSKLLYGRHLPFHEEQTNGGVADLRGYSVDQFRGDFLAFARAEYSVPITKWRFFAFRALAFWDSGFTGDYRHDGRGRDYLPSHPAGQTWFRNDVGAGFRVYVSSIVLPLLGLDVAYGIEGKAPEVYFEVGLTDF